jgi:hypothetical protein
MRRHGRTIRNEDELTSCSKSSVWSILRRVFHAMTLCNSSVIQSVQVNVTLIVLVVAWCRDLSSATPAIDGPLRTDPTCSFSRGYYSPHIERKCQEIQRKNVHKTITLCELSLRACSNLLQYPSLKLDKCWRVLFDVPSLRISLSL